MILNNKSTNPLAYTVSTETAEQKDKVAKDKSRNRFDPSYQPPVLHIAVFSGVTGNHPKELLNSPAFKADCEVSDPNSGIEVIDETSAIDATRSAMNVSESVKLPDFDVVAFCTRILPADAPAGEVKALEKKQIHVIENLFKMPTLTEIEKRSNVLAAIKRQYKSIETSIRKEDRAR